MENVTSVVGVDPGLSTAYAAVGFIGNIEDDWDNPERYRILDFGKWNNGGQHTPYADVVVKLCQEMSKLKWIAVPGVKMVIENQIGGKEAFRMPRNFLISGAIYGFAAAKNMNVCYVGKASKWPRAHQSANDDSKKDRIKIVQSMLSYQKTGNLLASWNALSRSSEHFSYKAQEDVADAVLMAACHLRELFISYLRTQGRITKKKRPRPQTYASFKKDQPIKLRRVGDDD
jgi:hypothetical protein